MKFEDLKFENDALGALSGLSMMKRARVNFPKGYGASVVSGDFTYSDEVQPYELAVLKNGSLCYDSGLTEDVIGYLSEDGVTELLQRIENL